MSTRVHAICALSLGLVLIVTFGLAISVASRPSTEQFREQFEAMDRLKNSLKKVHRKLRAGAESFIEKA